MPKLGDSKYWRFIEETALRHVSDECLIWPFHRMNNGYAPIGIPGTRTKTTASRVVCERLHGPAPTPQHQAAHNCGKGHLGCVNPNHIEWKTPAQNQADRIIHGTSNRGARQWMSKLEPPQVYEIRRLAKAKLPQAEIAARFGIEQPTVSRIVSRGTWAWLP
jgi:hypothetical protein